MRARNRRITLIGLLLIGLLGAGWLLRYDRVQAVCWAPDGCSGMTACRRSANSSTT